MKITAGDYVAEVPAFGGGPRHLSYQGKPLLVGYADGEFPPLSSSIVLAPWPNRTAEGVFAHGGAEHRLAITEPGRATAIHGFVGAMPWEVVEHREDTVTLRVHFGECDGWPWAMEMRVTWSLSAEEGLAGTWSVRNLSEESCPLGVGWHPYLSAQGAGLDECTLELPVRTNLPLDSVRNLPAGPEIPAGRWAVGNGPQLMNGVWLDHCFGVHGGGGDDGCGGHDRHSVPSGAPRDCAGGEGDEFGSSVELLGPDGAGVRLRADRSFGWYQVFTADPSRREGYPGVGRAVAVEPMTCPPNALRSGCDLIHLEGGDTREFRVSVDAVCC